MSAIFITATGTDIGKTTIAEALIRRLTLMRCDAIKPVVTGFDPSAPALSDPGRLLAALNRSVDAEAIEAISPWRYRAPLSPHLAAAQENDTIDFSDLVQFCRRTIVECRGTLIVEGVGGVMVPLNNRHTVLDWIDALGIPALLVTGSYLGSLSHTLTAMDVLNARKITIKAIVVSESLASTVSVSDTADTLIHFCPGVPVITAPRSTSHQSSLNEDWSANLAACLSDATDFAVAKP